MKDRNLIQRAAGVIFLTALFFSAAATASAQTTDLSPYVGDWQSSYSYLDDAKMDGAYTAIANAAQDIGKNYTADQVESFLRGMTNSDFTAMVIFDPGVADILSIGFDSGLVADYIYEGYTEVEWAPGVTFDWYKFAKEGAAEDDPYGYIIGTAVHQDGGDGMLHWHMRYGATGFKDLMGDSAYALWWPTLMASGTEVEKLVSEYTEGAAEFAQMLPATVPVPGSILILGAGLAIVSGVRRRKNG